MNTSRLSPTLDGSRWESRMPFNLLVAYEDQPTRDRALHLSHHLSKQLADDYDFRCSWWKFDHLANAILREQAANAAAEANMVVLAMNACSGLSPLQADWIHSWLPRRDSRKAALVALMATPASGVADYNAETTNYLRGLAKSSRLDFFSHSFDLPSAIVEEASAFEHRSEPVDPIIPGPPQDLPHHFKLSVPRWGINE